MGQPALLGPENLKKAEIATEDEADKNKLKALGAKRHSELQAYEW